MKGKTREKETLAAENITPANFLKLLVSHGNNTF